MAVSILRQDTEAALNVFDAPESCTISELGDGDRVETLEFLAVRPIHTVVMSSMIRDNGVTSPQNRGSFYACRDGMGRLEGIALIGHVTIIEARSEAALAAFARLSRYCLNTHLIRGEREAVESFWTCYADSNQKPRRVSHELLFEQREAQPQGDPVNLRPATQDDLERVLKINAAMAFNEGGTSPLNRDPSGFRHRTARRIDQDRVWVWVEDGKMIFKADVVAETPEVVYLEGVHVDAEERMKGYGLRCLTQLSQLLLSRTTALCLTINEENKKALAFYLKAGFQFHSHYETVYLRTSS